MAIGLVCLQPGTSGAYSAGSPPLVPWSVGPSGPTGRFGAVMAYDPAQDATVLFGGCARITSVALDITLQDNNTYPLSGAWCKQQDTLNDMWVYYGAYNLWLQYTPTGGPWPFARQQATIAYDYKSHSLILFGGLYQTNDSTAPNAADAQSCFGAAAEDGTPGVTSVVEQLSGLAHHDYCFQDTWRLNYGANGWQWQRLSTTTVPPARFDGGMGFDPFGRPTIVGGCAQMGMVRLHRTDQTPGSWDCSGYNDFDYSTGVTHIDAWQLRWTGIPDAGGVPNWYSVRCSNPETSGHDPCAPNEAQGMAVGFDGLSHTMMTYGGRYYDPDSAYNGYQGDTWQFDGSEWHRKIRTGTQDPFCPRLQPETAWSTMAPVNIAGTWELLQFGGRGKYGSVQTCSPGQGVNEFVSQKAYRWQNNNCVQTYNGNFSPLDSVCWWNDTHEDPGPHYHAAMAYDFTHGHVILVGGLTSLTDMVGHSDVWFYAGQNAGDPCGC